MPQTLDIFLVNTGKDAFLFTLYHDNVCRRRKVCTCGSLKERNKDGKIAIRRLPASYQIDAGQASGLLPAEVFLVPQVRNRINVGQLQRVTREQWLARGLSDVDWDACSAERRLALWRASKEPPKVAAGVVMPAPIGKKVGPKPKADVNPAGSGE